MSLAEMSAIANAKPYRHKFTPEETLERKRKHGREYQARKRALKKNPGKWSPEAREKVSKLSKGAL